MMMNRECGKVADHIETVVSGARAEAEVYAL
jgi:hypothetical protein